MIKSSNGGGMVVVKFTYFLLNFIFFSPLVSFAGPSCKEENYNEERFQAIQQEILMVTDSI